MTFNTTNFLGGSLRACFDNAITTHLNNDEPNPTSRFFWNRKVKSTSQTAINLLKNVLGDVLSFNLILGRTVLFINKGCTEKCIESPYYSKEIFKGFLITKIILRILITPSKGKYSILSYNAKKLLEKVNAKIDMATPVLRVISTVALAATKGFNYEMLAGYLTTTAIYYAGHSDLISKDNKAHFKNVYPVIGLISGKLFESSLPESFKL
jgi:hypothetical protein